MPSETGKPLIECIDWTITDRCNCSCLHCFHAADNTMHRDEFSYDEAMQLLDDIADCGIPAVRLTGGEPTLYPYFREVVKGIHKRGLILKTLITNGTLLSDELLDFLKEYSPKTEIMISFDGIGFHDWLRQKKGSEEQVLNAIRASINAGFPVFINANVNRRNRDVMFKSFQLLADLSIEHFRIIRTTEAPRWELNKEDYTLTPEEYYDFSCDFAKQYKHSRYTVPVMIWQSIYLDRWTETFSCYPVVCGAEDYREDSYLCSALFKKISVQANGEMAPCAPLGGYFAHYNIHMGNVHTEKLKDLLSGGRLFSSITHTVGEKLQVSTKCGSCRYAKNCQGGCPALSLLTGGSMLSPDLYKCVFFENGYYEKYCNVMEGWRNLTPV